MSAEHGLVFETRCLSSLSKVFSDEELVDEAYSKASSLRGEVFSFQVAFRSKTLIKRIRVSTNTHGLGDISVRNVGLVPSELPCYEDHDDDVLRTAPGLYPDPLYPIEPDEGIVAFPNQWRTIWATVKVNVTVPPGFYSIDISFQSECGDVLGQESFLIEVIDVSLPPQKLLHTEWFYADCLATWYEVEVFSEEHWKWIEVYLENAAKHGINMILTPIFTPPLETDIGHERPTVQLVDVKKCGDKYSFGFQKLDRWIEICHAKGIQTFEFSHLLTQWGAKNAPKILVEEDGALVQRFSWHTNAEGDEYLDFLAQFLTELVGYLEKRCLRGKVYFHISDEPSTADLKHYSELSRFVKSYITDYPILDALSDYEFYKAEAMDNPVPSNDCVDKFLENDVNDLWTYYCCGQYRGVSNRFFNMPSVRNRIIGVQLFKFRIKGFLHWGYNHWYSQKSRRKINPFTNTDAGFAFPSGDAFLVYPGPNGPIDSVRFEVFFEALQDVRALQIAETLLGREETIELLEFQLEQPITFDKYPRDLQWFLATRERLYQRIKQHVSDY